MKLLKQFNPDLSVITIEWVSNTFTNFMLFGWLLRQQLLKVPTYLKWEYGYITSFS